MTEWAWIVYHKGNEHKAHVAMEVTYEEAIKRWPKERFTIQKIKIPQWPVAQLEERCPDKTEVVGSEPTRPI